MSSLTDVKNVLFTFENHQTLVYMLLNVCNNFSKLMNLELTYGTRHSLPRNYDEYIGFFLSLLKFLPGEGSSSKNSSPFPACRRRFLCLCDHFNLVLRYFAASETNNTEFIAWLTEKSDGISVYFSINVILALEFY